MKRKLVLLLILALVIGALAGCGPKESGETPSEPPAEETTEPEGHTEATVIDSVEWKGTNTYVVSSSGTTVRYLVDSLITVTDDGAYCPNICSDFSIAEDGSSISFEIPTDFQFADGTPLTPEDVKRSLEYGLENSIDNADYANISEIKIDGQTVTLMLSSWNPATMFSLSRNMCPILPAAQLDSMSEEELLWGATPYGAYYLDEYVEGDHVTLKANPYYKTNNPKAANKGPATVETLTVRFITDAFAANNTLASNEAVSYVMQSETGVADTLAKNDKLATFDIPLNRVYWLLINSNNELFADSKVRQAIALAIDKDAICAHDDILGVPAWLFNSESSIGYAKEAADYNKTTNAYNKEKADALLKEAGWEDTDGDGILDKDGQKFSFVLYTREQENTLATLLQIQLKAIGMEVEIDTGNQTDKIKDDSYDVFIRGFGWGDVAGTLPYIANDENNPGLDRDAYLDLVAQANSMTDEAARVEKFGEAQKMLIDSYTMIPVLSQGGFYIYNTEYLNEDCFFAGMYTIPNSMQ